LKFTSFAKKINFKLCLFALSLAGLILAGFSPLYGADWAFLSTPGGHRKPVSALFQRGDSIVSAGEDGFLCVWSVNSAAAVDRFQISPHRITAMAGRPGRDEVCVVENDGMGLYIISVWNYRDRQKKFSSQFRDPINYISYSAGGNFIIAARTGRTALVLINANSGAVLPSLQSLTGTAGLAVTGRSERNMMVYLTSGEISYWDIESGNSTGVFPAPPNMNSTVLFSNNRYIAGVDAEGLAIVHATSGEVLARNASIPNGSLLYADGDDIICLAQKNNAAEFYRFTMDKSGSLVIRANYSIPASGPDRRFTAIYAGTGSAAFFGTSDGSLLSAASDGRTRVFYSREQIFIIDAAVSGSTMAFISDNGYFGFIPLEYQQFSNGSSINLEKNDAGYNRVTAFIAEPDQEGGNSASQFIFWHDKNTRLNPAIRSDEPGSQFKTLNEINVKSPIHTAASFDGKVLFLDTTGNLSLVAPTADKNPLYTFFSVGLMDAAFINSDQLILGRSAVSGNTPFMTINIKTGETVPLPHSSQAATALYRGGSGGIYAVTVSAQPAEGAQSLNETTGIRTQVILLNPANSADSTKLIDFQGEDTQFSLVESPGGHSGSIAVTIGGEGTIYTNGNAHKLDRTSGLPLRFLEDGRNLVSLDRDGNICWHDSRTGKLAAVFSLHPSGWTLRTERNTISGR
jgi:WD40 repeat protein